MQNWQNCGLKMLEKEKNCSLCAEQVTIRSKDRTEASF